MKTTGVVTGVVLLIYNELSLKEELTRENLTEINAVIYQIWAISLRKPTNHACCCAEVKLTELFCSHIPFHPSLPTHKEHREEHRSPRAGSAMQRAMASPLSLPALRFLTFSNPFARHRLSPCRFLTRRFLSHTSLCSSSGTETPAEHRLEQHKPSAAVLSTALTALLPPVTPVPLVLWHFNLEPQLQKGLTNSHLPAFANH